MVTDIFKLANSKRAAAEWEGNYGGLIMLLVISTSIIAYVLLTTETERERLGIIPEEYTRTLLDVSPGLVSQESASESKSAMFNLGAINLDYSVQKSTELLRSQLSVQKSAFRDSRAKIPVSIKPNVETATIEAVVSDKIGDGSLIILFNGKEIFSQQLGLNQKIHAPLPKSLLAETNVLEISVSSPGAKFWQTNSYSLLNVNLVTTAYEEGRATKAASFSLSGEQATGIESAQLQLYAGKTVSSANLKISVNGKEIYDGAKIGTLDVSIPAESLRGGMNALGFTVAKDGAYKISFAKVIVRYSKAASTAKKYNVLLNDYNTKQIAQNNLYCILSAARGSGGSSVTATVNNKATELFFSEGSAQEDICRYLRAGDNTIALTADEDVSLSSLKLTVMAKQ